MGASLRMAVLVLGLSTVSTPVVGQTFPVVADTHIAAVPAAKFPKGQDEILHVSNMVSKDVRRSFLRFDFTQLPDSAPFTSAHLQLWVSEVGAPGEILAYLVTNEWSESSLVQANEPRLGAFIGRVTVRQSDALHFIYVDLSPAVNYWRSGGANFGVALVPDSTGKVSVQFDSKENRKTSHPAELELWNDVRRTPSEIALLRWFPALNPGPGGNGCSGVDVPELNFRVGVRPFGIAFDGSSLWVVNQENPPANGNLTKLRPSDGQTLATVDLGAGSGAVAVAYDGVNIWVTRPGRPTQTVPGSLEKRRSSDGALIGQPVDFGIASAPVGLAFDGRFVWVALNGVDKVAKVEARTAKVVASYDVGQKPIGVAFDGESIWVTNSGSDRVTKIRASDGTRLMDIETGQGPYGVAYDGFSVWVANSGDNTVTRIRARDGFVLGQSTVGRSPRFLAFDGAHVWVANANDDTVTKLRTSDGRAIGIYPTGASPRFVAFDGANIWTTNHFDCNISKR